MAFYSSIAPYYDRIFPFDPAQAAFLIRSAERGAAFLDIGCGSGSTLAALEPRFGQLEGLDPDPGLLGLARAKLAALRPGPEPGFLLHEASMTELPDLVSGRRFDLVSCLGNTLPHLTDPGRLAAVFRAVRELLVPGGAFVFQIINFDRVMEAGVRALPTLRDSTFSFERRYSPPDDTGLISFQTVLRDAGGLELRNALPLRPLRQAELQAWLKQAGFGRVSFYGDFGGGTWTLASFLTIGLARGA